MKYSFAGLNECVKLDEKNSLGFIKDVHSCIGVLIQKDDCTLLMHLESYDKVSDISLLENNLDGAFLVELFKGDYTSEEALNEVIRVLYDHEISYTVNDVYRDESNQTSLGYDYNSDQYFIVRMDKGIPDFEVHSLYIK